MRDPYLYQDVNILKNKFDIKDEKLLDRIEAETSRTNMLILYANGFKKYTIDGICEVHKILFEDIYDWAGEYRTINVRKSEDLLAGQSVWYSSVDDIKNDLEGAMNSINSIEWKKLSKEDFAINVAHTFPALWQAHPFREGNTRTIVTFMVLFIESHGYTVDKQLILECSGYIRNAFVLCCFGSNSEFEHLENILKDAICYSSATKNNKNTLEQNNKKYKKYKTSNYKIVPHEYVEE